MLARIGGELMVLDGKVDPLVTRLDAFASSLDGVTPTHTRKT
jgi:hypothetical protein